MQTQETLPTVFAEPVPAGADTVLVSAEHLHVGADDGPIAIVEHDPTWRQSFLAERERIAPLLPGVQIHHIGSTAVPGLAAKPVIDMIALVDDLADGVARVTREGGYHLPLRFNDKLVHRRFLCYPTTSFRTHHLHLVDRREDLDRCLRFRDHLRADPKLAREYAVLKLALAGRYLADREGYTAAKSDFILSAEGPAGTNGFSAAPSPSALP